MHAVRLPPGMAAQLGIGSPEQEPPPGYAAYREAMRDTEIAERERVLRWAMIYCTCPRSYLAGPPGQAECLVHGGFMATYDGRVL